MYSLFSDTQPGVGKCVNNLARGGLLILITYLYWIYLHEL